MRDDLTPSFDPTEVGPLDLLRMWWLSVKEFVSDHALVVIPSAVGLVGLAWYLDVSVPEAPSWVLVGTGATVLFAPVALFTGYRLAEWLYSPDTVLLSVQDPVSGEQRLIHLAPERFDRMTVINGNGETRKKEFLETVTINGRTAYEVGRYAVEENVAMASSMAGRSNAQVRRDRAEIRNIKTDLEREADKALEVLVNFSSIVRDVSREVSMELIAAAEDVELPGSRSLHEVMTQRLEESDPYDDLVEDRGSESGSDEDDEQARKDAERQHTMDDGDGDIFDRAQAMSSGDEEFREQVTNGEVPSDD